MHFTQGARLHTMTIVASTGNVDCWQCEELKCSPRRWDLTERSSLQADSSVMQHQPRWYNEKWNKVPYACNFEGKWPAI